MFQAWVTKVTPQTGGVAEGDPSGVGHPNSLNYVIEIVTIRGEFLSIPNGIIRKEQSTSSVCRSKKGSTHRRNTDHIQANSMRPLKARLEGDQVVSLEVSS
jgi:hypothetical protein